MSKKLYVCKECGNVFPEDLHHLIEKNVQIYCEKCGRPFSLEGVQFKEAKFEEKERVKVSREKYEEMGSSLEHFIKKLNIFSWIPILILSVILLFTGIFTFFGIFGILISLYDLLFISRKIKSNKYDEIALDAICMGILGCIVFGTGAIILIKGILIFIDVILNNQKENLGYYDYGLKLKNSLNNFSALAGFFIFFLAFHSIVIGDSTFDGSFIARLSIASIALFIDLLFKKKIKRKQKFDIIDSAAIIALGVLGTIFFASGIFILLKGVIIFFLLFGKPTTIERTVPSEEIVPSHPPDLKDHIQPVPAVKEEPEKKFIETEKKEYEDLEKPIEMKKEEEIKEVPIEIKEKKEPREVKIKKERKEIKTPKSDKGPELKLHESLLPVKNEKDKKIVEDYFLKIFTLLSKDIRKQIMDLNIPEDQKRELLKELAFLAKEEQHKYVESIIHLYKEIPTKLIERIKKLPNVKPEYYVKIAEQLKFMDSDDQVKFIQFLENNA
jgi:DNA-directed RNA polymerase subunit RPC12/RpoP